MAEINDGQVVGQEANDNLSPEELFLLQQESYEDAAARAEEESSSGLKVNRLKVDKDGVYPLRFAPLAPAKNEEHKRGGYEYPAHVHLMKINNPKGGDKAKPIYVSITRANECGFPIDAIDVYRKLAVDKANEKGDEELAKKIGGGGFGGGLRFDYNHYAYVIDVDSKKDGWQLFTMSHSQFKELDDAKLSMWKKLCKSDPKYPCPISSVKEAYVTELTRKTENKKTSYSFNIDAVSPKEPLTSKELQDLLSAPRIYEILFRYSRFHHEAVQAYLKQCDEVYGLDVFQSQEVQDAIKQITDMIPASDTSHFSFDKKSTEQSVETTVSIDSLYDEFDALDQKGLGDKTEEGQALRQKIRDFMKENNLEHVITIGRSTTNIMILDAIATYLDGDKATDSNTNLPEPTPDSSAVDEPTTEEESEPEPERTATRERRSREGRPARG